MMHKAIRQKRNLPKVGKAFETSTLDFKVTYNPSDKEEMAKDVAAFANAVGGCILVGAREANEILLDYSPLPMEIGSRIRTAIGEAIKEYCSPRPIVDTAIIEHGKGVLVAANVAGFPGQPVGVRGSGKFAEYYRFLTEQRQERSTSLRSNYRCS